MSKMTSKEKTNMLAYLLPTVKSILADYLVYPEQEESLDNFCIDIVAIADAEICYEENMERIMLFKDSGIKQG